MGAFCCFQSYRFGITLKQPPPQLSWHSVQWYELSDTEYMVLYISDSKLTPRSFYNYLLVQLGCKPVLHRNAARDSLHRQIEIMRSMQNRKAVVIVDEAHLLDLLENGELDEMTRDEITMYMLDILDRYEFPHPIRNLEDFRILHYVPF